MMGKSEQLKFPNLESVDRSRSEAEKSKDDAIHSVEINNEIFVQVASKTLERLAYARQYFSSLDVWKIYEGPRPHHPRAMGPVFMRAKNTGWIVPTNTWINSGRTTDHNQQLRIWRSLKFRWMK